MLHDSTDADAKNGFKRVSENLYRAHNGRYYGLAKKAGKQIKKSLRTNDRKLAERRLKEFLAKVERTNPASEHKNILFEELAALWLRSIKHGLKPKSFERRETSINGLLPSFRGTSVRSLGARHIEAWKTKRAPEISPRTWNIDVDTLRLVLAYARDELRIICENPAVSVKRKKESKNVVRPPSREQFGKLVAELRKGHRATGEAADLVEFLAYSGCRVGEALGVRWRDIDSERGKLLITGGDAGTKNHEQRSLPMSPALSEFLQAMRQRKKPKDEDELLFGIKTASHQLRRACKRLKFPHWGHHAMRHFFCTNAVEQGIDFKVIADWVGHKDGGVLVAKTYGHLRQGFSEQMAQRMTFRAEV